jgi:hypothetical protein
MTLAKLSLVVVVVVGWPTDIRPPMLVAEVVRVED